MSTEKSVFGNSGRPHEDKVLSQIDAVLAGAGSLRSAVDLLFNCGPQLLQQPREMEMKAA